MLTDELQVEVAELRSENRAYRSWLVHAQHMIASLESAGEPSEAHALVVAELLSYPPFEFAVVVDGDDVVYRPEELCPDVVQFVCEAARGLPHDGTILNEPVGPDQQQGEVLRWFMAGLMGSTDGRVRSQAAADGSGRPICIVGRTERTHEYFGDSTELDVELFGLLLMSLSQAYASMYLRQALVAERNGLQTQVALATADLQQALDNARAARDTALAASKAKSTFLANMSHELRTPLNAVIGYSELLMEECQDLSPEEVVSDLTRIHDSASHLLALIADILDLSKIEAGRVDVDRESIDLSEFAASIAVAIDPLSRRNDNKLEVTAPNSGTAFVGDATRLRQMVLNLAGNACKFTHHGTVAVRFEVVSEDEVRKLRIVVADTGIGMTAEQQRSIFQPFVQGDRQISVRYGGTGLGLAITQRFCELMDASISLQSEPGVGTEFQLLVPESQLK